MTCCCERCYHRHCLRYHLSSCYLTGCSWRIGPDAVTSVLGRYIFRYIIRTLSFSCCTSPVIEQFHINIYVDRHFFGGNNTFTFCAFPVCAYVSMHIKCLGSNILYNKSFFLNWIKIISDVKVIRFICRKHHSYTILMAIDQILKFLDCLSKELFL